jgi:hypothetical protein
LKLVKVEKIELEDTNPFGVFNIDGRQPYVEYGYFFYPYAPFGPLWAKENNYPKIEEVKHN